MNFSFMILIPILFVLGCSSSDSNPKDYWYLSEPQVFAWDTSEDANVRGFSQSVSNFSSDSIKDTLDYQSYIQFTEPTSEFKMEVLTSCTPSEGEKTKALKKKFKIATFDKLYFYNYLPDQVIYDEAYQDSSQNFKCNFKFTAINKINSKHNFTIDGISINTFRRNVLTINSVDNNKENPSVKTILPTAQNKNLILPSIYYNQKGQTYIISQDLKSSKLIAPGFIQCKGEKNKFTLSSYNNELLTRMIGEVLIDQLRDGTTTFLKKCRVITKIKANDDTIVTDENEVEGLRTVWSEYFNVIFEEPKISVEVEKIDNSGILYPLNKDNYLDQTTHAFNLVFTNDSNKEIVVRLPAKQSILATLSPLIYSAQADKFKATNLSWGGLSVLEAPEIFETKLRFTSEGIRIAEFVLKPQSKKIINIEIKKNFSCKFGPVQKSYGDQTSERGFRIRAIDLNSEDNMITLDYKNQGVMESYPELFSFSSLLELAKNKDLKTIGNGKKSKRKDTNFLQWNIDRTTAIDTIVFRDLSDLNIPEATFNSFGGGDILSQPTTAELMRQEIYKAKKKSNYYPSVIMQYKTDKTFCTQVY